MHSKNAAFANWFALCFQMEELKSDLAMAIDSDQLFNVEEILLLAGTDLGWFSKLPSEN